MPQSLLAFIMLFLGAALLRTFNVLNRSHADRLASLVFSISLPSTILVSLDSIEFAPTAWKLPLAASLVTLPMLLVTWQIGRLLQLPRVTRGGVLLGTGCINSIYFAYPVVLATLGQAGLAQAILFDLGQTALTLTLLYAVALWHGTSPARGGTVVQRFLAAPPLWALTSILVAKLFELRLPAVLLDLLWPVHMTTTPLASLVLGLSISITSRDKLGLAALGVVLRMVGGLLFGFAAAGILDLNGLERVVVILLAGMPSAVTAVIFAAEAGLDEELVASIVALSVALGVAVLPWLPQFTNWLSK